MRQIRKRNEINLEHPSEKEFRFQVWIEGKQQHGYGHAILGCWKTNSICVDDLRDYNSLNLNFPANFVITHTKDYPDFVKKMDPLTYQRFTEVIGSANEKKEAIGFAFQLAIKRAKGDAERYQYSFYDKTSMSQNP